MPQSEALTDLQRIQSLGERHAALPTRRLDVAREVWIFGAGQFGRDVCAILQGQGFGVRGFVETRPTAAQVMGLPVRDWQQWAQVPHAAQSAQLVLGIFNRGMPFDALHALARAAGAQDIFMPWDIYSQFQAQLGWRYWLSDAQTLLEQLPAIERTFARLSDAPSQRCLADICEFRLGLKLDYAGFRHTDNQYFNALTLPPLAGRSLRYVDGGAYNGDTYAELCGLAEVQSAYLFEPDADNYQALLRQVQGRDAQASAGHKGRAQCLPVALSDGYQMLSFSAGAGEGAAISESGSQHIAAAALDGMLCGESVDFIKLDVEGAEVQALRGARQLIHRSRPVLAISLYHRPQDIWALPELLASLCDNYALFIRQHFCNSFDSVLYAVPHASH